MHRAKSSHANHRELANENEALQMLQKTFPENALDLLKFEKSDGIEKLRSSMRRCGLFIGLHGAGLMNEIYLPKDSLTFELVTNDKPAYCRNVASLRGLRYDDLEVAASMQQRIISVDVPLLRKT